MKPKLNLSGDGIKGFFFANGEKLILGATLLVLLFFLYGAITAKPLDDSKSPNSIIGTANAMEEKIRGSGELPKFPETRFGEAIARSEQPATFDRVKFSTSLDPPIFKELQLRTEPEFYPVEDLQIASLVATVPYQQVANLQNPAGALVPQPVPVRPLQRGGPAGHDEEEYNTFRRPPNAVRPGQLGAAAPAAAVPLVGASAYGAHAPGADPQPKCMAVITGLIPFEKQSEAYRRTFEYALPAGQVETPIYQFFNVQRAEVKDAADTNYNWEIISYKLALDDTAKWAVAPPTPELADPQHVCPPAQVIVNLPIGIPQPFTTFVTWPLPPMYLKNWGPESVHPKIPLFKVKEAAPAAQADPNQLVDFNAAPVAPGPGAQQIGAPNEPPPAQVVNKLFRYVDLTAKSGKTYRYRFQLVLSNPNYINPSPQQAVTTPLLARHLAKPLLGALQRREAPYSEPTPPVTMPGAHRILADSVSVAGGRGAEPKAKVDVLTFVRVPSANAAAVLAAVPAVPAAPGAAAQPNANADQVWLEVMKDTDVLLGGIAYLADVAIEKVFDPTIETERNLQKVTIDTNQSMLIDLRNDDPLGANNRSKGPAEMLFFEPRTGRLVAVNSGADVQVKKHYKERTTPVEGAGGAPAFVPGVLPAAPATPGKARDGRSES